MRGRSYSPSPPPPRGYGRRGRSPSPRGRYGGGRSSRDGPTSLLVRNLRLDCRPEDLRRPFGQFGPLKDIYLPKNYHSGEARGFGFVQYVDPSDAAEAKYQMDGQILQGRQLTVVFAEENRKKPADMRARERGSGRFYDRRRSPPRYSRSPPPRYSRSRSRNRDYYSPSPKRRHYSRSVSPEEKRYSRENPRHSRERSYSRSPVREHSPPPPPFNDSRDHSRSPVRERSPPYNGSRSRSPGGAVRERSPISGPSRSPSPSCSRSRSPYPVEPDRGESPSP